MPKLNAVTATEVDRLRPFQFHGVDIDRKTYGKEAIGECPFCNKNKFYVNMETGEWSCKTCQNDGNIYTFLRLLWEKSEESPETSRHLPHLSTAKRLLKPATLTAWGVVRSLLTQEWLVPGYGVTGSLNQLYRYEEDPTTKRKRLLATPTCNHQIHGIPLYDQRCETVYLTEGPWDGMCFWEILSEAKLRKVPTQLPPGNVLAVPGAGVFYETWSPLFADKEVFLLYDNDHPVKGGANQPTIPGAGIMGMRRVAEILIGCDKPPKQIRYLRWGQDGYDAELPTGYDLRDAISKGTTIGERVRQAESLFGKVTAIPAEWVALGQEQAKTRRLEADIVPVPCDSWVKLIRAWRKALKWTDGLDCALSVMLSCVTSTKVIGDQLWARVISPPSTGKSVLCEALSINKNYIKALSTLKGFYSGYQADKNGQNDNSLIGRIKDKTLVIKDGDTLLQSPNRDQILSEMRDIYDRVSRSSFKNKMSRDYVGINLTVVLCGTSSLRLLDTSELGERFLSCIIMDGVDTDIEDEVLWRVANKAEQATNYEANGKRETHYEPDMVKAMQLTGGYVEYLRNNAPKLLRDISMGDAAKKRCISLGKFVAYLRARPSPKQDEVVEREFAPRLVSQHIRLAKCMAAVLNRDSVDAEVLRRVSKVAMDTAKGRTLELVRWLYKAGRNGATLRSLAIWANESNEKCKSLLRFMRRIGIVEAFQRSRAGLREEPRWRLSDTLLRLYVEVVFGREIDRAATTEEED